MIAIFPSFRSALWLFLALSASPQSPPAPSPAASLPADLVLRGGKVITVDARDRISEAVAVRGNRIVAVGSDREMSSWVGPETRTVELRGRAVVPGFIDAHTHVEHTARFLHFLLNVHCPPLRSSAEVLETVVRKAAELPSGSWIVGQGTYGQPMPTREELDRAVPDHPVVLRWSMHRAVVNRKALELSGIDRNTPDPRGGRIERRPEGEPTGILEEAFDILAIPPYPYAALKEALRETLREQFLKQGVTTVYELPATSDAIRAYQELSEQGELPIRLQLNLTIAPGHQPLIGLTALLKLGIRTGWGDDWLRLGAIKIFVDGAGEAAATYSPHPGGPENYGLTTRTTEELHHEVMEAHRAGWQLWLHAIGERAQDMTLDALESALRSSPREDHRHRIEHMANTLYREEALLRLKRRGIIPVPTAAFLYRTPDSVASRMGGPPLYALSTLIQLGLFPPGNSDTAGTQTFAINPMFSLASAVTRKSRGGIRVSPEEAVSVLEAIRMHTAYAAYAGFEEKRKGSLQLGKLADLVVLSEDPLAVEPERLMEIRVDMTILDGKIAYHRP